MRSIRSSRERGQVSLEALLLWAALAASLAALLPVFSSAMDAFALQQETNTFVSFGDHVESTLNSLSFLAPGTRTTLIVPRMVHCHASLDSDSILLTLSHPALSQDKVRTIDVPLPLSGNLDCAASSWTVTRLEDEIILESE